MSKGSQKEVWSLVEGGLARKMYRTQPIILASAQLMARMELIVQTALRGLMCLPMSLPS